MSTNVPNESEGLRYLVEEVGKGAVQVITADGEEFIAHASSFTVEPPPHPRANPLADAIKVHTLQSVVDFLTGNVDHLDLATHYLHISGPTQVNLIGPLTEFHRKREIPLVATFHPNPIPFGTYQPPDEFITSLLSAFVAPEEPTGDGQNDRDRLIKTVSRIRFGTQVVAADSGLSQRVEVEEGPEILAEEKVENPVWLRPYRTFPEIDQPASAFIVRLRQIAGGIGIALFEADGGQWRLGAVRAIQVWLAAALAEAFPGDEPKPTILA